MKKLKLVCFFLALQTIPYFSFSQSGKCLLLDGVDDYMSVTDHSDIDMDPGENITITCWIKTSASTDFYRILGKRSGTANGYEFFTGTGSNAGKFATNVKHSSANVGTGYSPASISNDTWHHLALVLDATSGRNVKTYIDGVLAATGPTFTGSPNFSNAVNLVIGASSSLTYKWPGKIDDIRVWSKAMTQSEVQSDMIAIVNGPATNLLAGWDFENVSGTNVPDISGNSHPGTLFGGATVLNVFNMALSFDGVNDFVSVADHADLDIDAAENFSFTCWVKTGDYGKRILTKRPGTSSTHPGYEFINNTSPNGQFGVNLRSTTGVNAGPPYGTSNIANNSWHHLAMVINVTDNTCKIYVDGALQQTSTNTVIGTGSFANAASLFLGSNYNQTQFWSGTMDDMRLWAKALSVAEVTSDMTAVLTGSEANLLAAWDFENVSGTTAPDISGRNHPGTINGGAVLVPRNNNNMQYSSTTLLQTELPAGKGDTDQRIIAVNVVTSGTLNPVNLTTLKFSTTGTTNLSDVTGIKVYYTGANNRFNTNTLYATVTPQAGMLTATGTQTLASGNNYFWIAYDVATAAAEGNILDATCDTLVIAGNNYVPSTNTVAGNRVVLLAHKLLFSGGDLGSSNYRIPAIVTALDGSLITAADKRNNGSGDLGSGNVNIDIVVRRSTDNGQTWSTPLVIADFGAVGASDPALVVDRTTGHILCLYASGPGVFYSNPNNPIRIFLSRSTDNGVTWQTPVDITNHIYGAGCTNTITQNWYAAWVASGAAHQMRNGRIVAAIGVRQTSGNQLDNFMIYSDDGGTTWLPSTGIAETNGDEAKLVELNNGNLMMSIRNPGTRRMNTSSTQGTSWGTAYNQTDLTDPNCDGDFIRYTSTLDGYDQNRLLHTIPWASSRKNVSVLISYDEGVSWTVRKTIFPGASAYSGITVLSDGTLGMYYENGEYESYQMYFARFSLDWLTNGADTYSPPTPPPAANKTSGLNLPVDSKANNDLAVYPNPAHDFVNIKTTRLKTVRIEIFNVLGQKQKNVISPGGDGVISVNTAHLSKGVYFISVFDKNRFITSRKLVIK